MKTKTISLLILSVLILSGCNAAIYLKRNKADGYYEKITGNLTVLLTHSEGERYTGWSTGFKEKLVSEFGKHGVKVEIAEFPVLYGISTLTDDDVKTTNSNGLIMIVAEERIIEEGKSVTSEFSFTLVDKNRNINVWKATIPAVIKGGLGSLEARGRKTVKYLFDLLKKDELI